MQDQSFLYEIILFFKWMSNFTAFDVPVTTHYQMNEQSGVSPGKGVIVTPHIMVPVA
jgi:hypothetical protein